MASNKFLQLYFCAIILSLITLGADCATYGESCDANSDPCTDVSLTCDGSCGCSTGFVYNGSGDICQPRVEHIGPNYYFKSSSTFLTEMELSDLTQMREETLRSDLGPQLEKLFHNVTGFVRVAVGDIYIIQSKLNVLVIEYTVVLDADDPAFAGNKQETRDVLQNDLSQVASKYEESIVLDTTRHQYKGDDTVDDTSVAIGVGVGVGALVVILVIVGLAMFLCKRRSEQAAITKKEPAVKSPGTISSNCSTSGRSTQLDADDYKYSVFVKNGLSLPPHYASKAPASSTSGSAYQVVDDTDPVYQN